jgi:hypothetical protein
MLEAGPLHGCAAEGYPVTFLAEAMNMKVLLVRKLIGGALVLGIALGAMHSLEAAQTVGGVNWLEPLGYTKPAFYPITVPAVGANRYWVDLGGGSGTSCTATAPCGWSAVQGKPGTRGDGGAYIYIKGTGGIGSPTLYGAAGQEVVIKPWDDNTLATITGRNNWTGRVQYVIFDGGPNLKIKFSSTSNSQYDPSIYFNASSAGLQSHITFYRTQWNVPGMGEYIAQWGIVDNLNIINSEFQSGSSTDRNNQHHIYFSGASNYGPSAHIYLRNNIFRDTPGEQIEFRMFQTIDDVVIDGNVFHNIGKGSCSISWKCRPAITVASSGASPTNLQISNNLMWDLGEGAVRMWTGSPLVYNNSVFQWGQGSPANGGYGQWAFYGYQGDGKGTVRNNILYGTGSTSNGNALIPFDASPFTKSNNVCASASTSGCGYAFATSGTNQTVVSLSPDSPGFMMLTGTLSTASSVGMTLSSVLTSYLGGLRGAPYDIGATTSGVVIPVPVVPAAPTQVRIVR